MKTDDSSTAERDDDAPSLESLVGRLDRLWKSSPGEAGPASINVLVQGTRIGKYEIKECIGHGAFGIVYLARDAELARDVALKLPRLEVLLDDEKRKRFHREATAAAAIDHPLIVPIYEAHLDGPWPYIATAYCPGTDLGQWLELNPQKVPPRTAAEFVAQLADAVHFAHGRGVVHRDIKPGNILLTASSVATADSDDLGDFAPRLTDFGLAKLHEASFEETQVSLLIGTPLYMAPEQLGSGGLSVGPAADVYALGVLLYQLVCGRPPYESGSYFDVLAQIRSAQPASLSRLCPQTPRDLEIICLKCLEKDPEDRYASAAELAADLRRQLGNLPIQARAPTLTRRLGKWAQRHHALVAMAGLCCTLLAAALAVSVVAISRSRSQALHALESTADMLYAADMTVAYQSWEKGWTDEARRFLHRYVPAEGEQDRRGFEWHLLNDLVRAPGSLVMTGHQGPVNELAVFADRQRLASVGDDGTLRLWSVAGGKLLRTIKLTDEPLSSVAVSPDGQFVAAGSTILYLVSMNAPNEVSELLACDYTIESVCFRSDGQALAAGTRYDEVTLLSLDGGVIQRQPLKSRLRTLEFLPHSQLFLTTNQKAGSPSPGVAQLWDARLRNVQHEFLSVEEGHPRSFSIARSSPCESYIVATDEYHPVATFFHRATGNVVGQTRPYRATSRDLAYAPDGQSVAIGHDNGVVERFRVHAPSNESLTVEDRPLAVDAHEGQVRSVRFVDAHRLASCGADGRIVLWNFQSVDNDLDLAPDESRAVGFALSPDGNSLFYCSNREAIIADLRTQTICYRQPAEFGSLAPAWSPSSSHVAMRTSHRNEIVIISRDGSEMRTIAHQGLPEATDYSPDGDLLACIGEKCLQAYDAESGELLFSHPLPAKGTALTFTPDGQSLVYALVGGRLGVLGVATRQLLQELTAPSDVTALQHGPIGSVLATGHEDSAIRIWDLSTGRLQLTLSGHDRPISDLVYSPDGGTLISSSVDQSVRVWSLKHGRCFGILRQGDLGDARVSLSADGKRMATCIRRDQGPPTVLMQNLSIPGDGGFADSNSTHRAGF